MRPKTALSEVWTKRQSRPGREAMAFHQPGSAVLAGAAAGGRGGGTAWAGISPA
jgi:hypothetical protein